MNTGMDKENFSYDIFYNKKIYFLLKKIVRVSPKNLHVILI